MGIVIVPLQSERKRFMYPVCMRPSPYTQSGEQILSKIWKSLIQMTSNSALHLLGLPAAHTDSLKRIDEWFWN